MYVITVIEVLQNVVSRTILFLPYFSLLLKLLDLSQMLSDETADVCGVGYSALCSCSLAGNR